MQLINRYRYLTAKCKNIVTQHQILLILAQLNRYIKMGHHQHKVTIKEQLKKICIWGKDHTEHM